MTTTETNQPKPGAEKPRRHFVRNMAIATAIAGLASVVGIKAFAHGHGGWHRGGFMGAAIDPAMMDEHLDRILKPLYVETDATEAQTHQLAPLAKAAAHDLLPMRTPFREGRRPAGGPPSPQPADGAALAAA